VADRFGESAWGSFVVVAWDGKGQATLGLSRAAGGKLANTTRRALNDKINAALVSLG
jgi:hypothetical protein